ncbi:defensin-like protein, partial [Trifolium medium]|nr:defensin-like protein [Trifolium medium]
MLDVATKKRAFRHYARILVDIDLSKRIYDEVMVERDGFVFYVKVIYERLPAYCNHCYSIGHLITNCCKLHPQEKPVEKVVKVQAQKQYIPKQSSAPVIDLEKKIEHQEDIVRVNGDLLVTRVTEDEIDDSTEKIVNHNPNEILKETNEDDATITDLERHNEDDVAMVTDPERQNGNFNHSASEEVLEEEITLFHTDTAHNNIKTIDPNMSELASNSEEEVVAKTQIILQQPVLPLVVLDDMEKIKQ